MHTASKRERGRKGLGKEALDRVGNAAPEIMTPFSMFTEGWRALCSEVCLAKLLFPGLPCILWLSSQFFHTSH